MEITTYTNELELKYYYTRNKEHFVCGCGKNVLKNISKIHFRTKYHILNNNNFFLREK